MAEYEDNPQVRYQASLIKVCAKINQVKEPQEPEPPVDKKIVMVTVPYAKSEDEEAKDCLRMRVDTCADINIMPLSVYQTIFNDLKKEKLLPTGIQVTTYNDSTLDLIGRCMLYLQHPKDRVKVSATFYVTQDEGSVLLSCSTSLKLEVIEVPEQRPIPPYMPIYTSSIDKPKFTECPAANKTCHKCGKNGHFARACLGKSFKHRVQSLQAEQEIEMAEYEDNPQVRYQASQIKVCAKINQVKEPQEPEPPVDKKIVMVTVPYAKSEDEEAKDCLRMRVDTCADINIMPLITG